MIDLIYLIKSHDWDADYTDINMRLERLEIARRVKEMPVKDVGPLLRALGPEYASRVLNLVHELKRLHK